MNISGVIILLTKERKEGKRKEEKKERGKGKSVWQNLNNSKLSNNKRFKN